MKKSEMNEGLKKRKKILRASLILLIILLLLLTFSSIMRYMILFIFIFMNYFFAIAKKKVSRFIGKYFFGIELIMFCTVLTSVSFGSFIGATMGALLMVVNYIAERRFSKYFLVTVPLYMVIGYFAYFFRSYDIVLLGIIITIAYNIVAYLLTSFFDPNIRTLVIFNMINIGFNVFLFYVLGRIFYNMLI